MSWADRPERDEPPAGMDDDEARAHAEGGPVYEPAGWGEERTFDWDGAW